MSDKKGVELSLQAIVIAALAVIALVVILIIFGSQIRKAIFGYNDVTNNSIGTIKGNNCGSLFSMDRKCFASGCPTGWKPVPGSWSDCTTGACCETG
jgi:hypothetical protein